MFLKSTCQLLILIVWNLLLFAFHRLEKSKCEIISYTNIIAHNISFICRKKTKSIVAEDATCSQINMLYNESTGEKNKKQRICIQSVHEITLLFYFCAVRKHLLVPFFKYLPEIPINNRNTHKFEIVSYTYIMAHNITFICREKQNPLLLRTLLILKKICSIMNLQKKTRNNGFAYNLSMKKTLLFFSASIGNIC